MGRRKNDPPISGVLLIDKPGGMTSHDVVGRVRRALGIRRVGHAGTLDPMATGVLVIGVGPSTRLLGIVGGHDKEYLATIRLGASTTTDDSEGELLEQSPAGRVAAVSDAVIREAVSALTGTIAQRPSSVSAVKIDGKRSYQRVREGQEVELPEREVHIQSFEILGIERGGDHIDVRVRVECSAGTYIRALARDLGASVDLGGHLVVLRRSRSGAVNVSDCLAIDDVTADSLRPAAWLARAELPGVDIDAGAVLQARNGVRVASEDSTHELRALVGPDDDLVAIVESDGSYRVVFPALS
jgi:tRNA pseudouridine55 synthase